MYKGDSMEIDCLPPLSNSNNNNINSKKNSRRHGSDSSSGDSTPPPALKFPPSSNVCGVCERKAPSGAVPRCTCGSASIHHKRKFHLPLCSSCREEPGDWPPAGDRPSSPPCSPHRHVSSCGGGLAPAANPGSPQHSPRWNQANKNNGNQNGPHPHRTAIISRILTDTALTLIQESVSEGEDAAANVDAARNAATAEEGQKLTHRRRVSSAGANLTGNADELQESESHVSFLAYIIDDPNIAYGQYMQARRVYDVIPVNTKFVVLDTSLSVRKAFYALIYNGVRSALLWNSKDNQFCGLLTVTDFIHILIHTYDNSPDHTVQNMENQLISQWREVLLKEHKLKPLVFVTVNDTILKACKVLIETRFHRLPIFDDSGENALHFLTHKRILRYLYLVIDKLPTPEFLALGVREAGVGTYDDLLSVNVDTPLIECFRRLVSRRLSALPVLDDRKVVVDIYARFDAIGVAAESAYDTLDRPVLEALNKRKKSKWYKGVITCLETDTIRQVVDKLYENQIHGLVIVDQKCRLRGVVTLYDVLKYIIIDQMPSNKQQQASFLTCHHHLNRSNTTF